jgi:hypothetical protein
MTKNVLGLLVSLFGVVFRDNAKNSPCVTDARETSLKNG